MFETPREDRPGKRKEFLGAHKDALLRIVGLATAFSSREFARASICTQTFKMTQRTKGRRRCWFEKKNIRGLAALTATLNKSVSPHSPWARMAEFYGHPIEVKHY